MCCATPCGGGAGSSLEDLFIPWSLIVANELQRQGNTNCWKPEPITSFTGFLNSECVWIQYWVQLDSAEQRERYQAYLDNYVAEQKQLGRFGRPTNNVLLKVSQVLDIREAAGDDSPVLVGLSFMFLAVCVLNTVGLLLAKFIGKAPQIGLRRALGATRTAIFGQHLIEVGVVGLAGGVLGLVLAWVGLRGVQTMLEESDRYAHLDVNMLVAGLALLLHVGSPQSKEGDDRMEAKIDAILLAVEPNKTLSYTWDYAHDDAAYNLKSVVTFTLTRTATGTHLRMEQSGFRPEQKQAYGGARYGWQQFFDKLEKVLARND